MTNHTNLSYQHRRCLEDCDCVAMRVRRAVRAAHRRGLFAEHHGRTGIAAELARHFGLSRQRLSQVVKEVRREAASQ